MCLVDDLQATIARPLTNSGVPSATLGAKQLGLGELMVVINILLHPLRVWVNDYKINS